MEKWGGFDGVLGLDEKRDLFEWYRIWCEGAVLGNYEILYEI